MRSDDLLRCELETRIAQRAHPAPPLHQILCRRLLREASAELAHLRRIRGAHRRTARRIARERARLAFAAALLGAPLGEPALGRPPSFVDPLASFGLWKVGDLASPDFADIDGDGDLDAFVGEYEVHAHAGNTIFFENTGTASVPAFTSPATNPFGLAAVGGVASPAFADLDGDGDLDGFVGSISGSTLFFHNTGTASAPAFAAPATNPFGLADVSSAASPAFADLDGDGDLDAFVGEYDANTFAGNTIFFENTGASSAPAFGPAATNPFGLAGVAFRASPVFADLDGDADLDAFVGDGAGNTISFENTGTPSAPAFGPPATNSFGLADVGYAASPAFADIDSDGDLDAFVGSSSGHTIFFGNTGTANAPALVSPPINPFGLTDGADLASPHLADIDGDGDLDAFVGDEFGFTSFFENTGTRSAPAFSPPTTHPFGLYLVGDRSSPAFGDVDGDGDLDAFVGVEIGLTKSFENTGTASAPAFAPAVNPFGPVVVGRYASPDLADVDGDGDLDAFVGAGNGDTMLFENTSTAGAPAFAPQETNPFGLAAVLSSASPDFADIDDDGDVDALVGNRNGDTIFFENTGTPSLPAFAPQETNPFGLGNVGRYASPDFADLDGDGDLDALVGREDGALIFFENLASLCPATPAPGCTEGFAKGSLSVDERKPAKQVLTARLSKGPALAQSDFGDPTLAEGTTVALCVYDDAGVPVAALEVDRAAESCGSKACWKAIGGTPPDGKGFVYKDAAGSADGVRSLSLKGGAAGKSSLAVSASNKKRKGQTALPTGIATALAGAASVTLQIQASDGACFSTTLVEIRKSTPEIFQAK